jgi:hypothetical protein
MPFSENIANQENRMEVQIENVLKDTNEDLEGLEDLLLEG